MDNKQDLRIARTQKHLREALYELIAEKPVNKITIRELTEKAELSRCTFYLHYDSIFDMIKSIEEEMLSDYRDGLRHILSETSDPRALATAVITFSFRHKYDNLPYAKTLYMNSGCSELISQYTKIAVEELQNAFSQQWNDRITAALNFYISGIINLIHEWILGDITESPEEMSAQVIDIIKNGDRYLNMLSK